MKILYLTKYSRNAGSSRLRSYQYIPYLEQAEISVEISPLFSETYLQNLYAKKSTKKEAIKAYAKRFFKLFSIGRYNKIVIEKEIFPYLPAFAEQLFHFLGVKYIVDYDDAIFHNYDQSKNPIIKKLLGNKIGTVMKHSDIVVAGNTYLAEYAKKSGAKTIEVIPTVIDLERYSIKEPHDLRDSEKFVVGWIGTQSTFEKHLLPCKDWMKKLQKEHPEIHFHIVGISEDMDLGPNVKYIPWHEKTEVAEILKMDVGIMPLQDTLWEKGKCSYKLIQYMACGIPGIASDVGMNREVALDHETGFLASTPEEWIEKILFLKFNPEIKQNLGKQARLLIEKKYCIQVTAGQWIKLLFS